MRFVVAVEDYRGQDTIFMDLPEEFLGTHPEIVIKMGEIMGIMMRDGGEITWPEA